MNKLDLIVDTLDYINKFTNLDVEKALAAARELKALKPVGELFLGGIDTDGEYDGCDVDLHMSVIEALQERLVKHDPIKLPLYALDEVTK